MEEKRTMKRTWREIHDRIRCVKLTESAGCQLYIHAIVLLYVFRCLCPSRYYSVSAHISAPVRLLGCSISLIAGVFQGQLFDLWAVLGLSTRCAGWSPIMLD